MHSRYFHPMTLERYHTGEGNNFPGPSSSNDRGTGEGRAGEASSMPFPFDSSVLICRALDQVAPYC